VADRFVMVVPHAAAVRAVPANRGVTVVRPAAARRVDWASRVAAVPAAARPAVAADRAGSMTRLLRLSGTIELAGLLLSCGSVRPAVAADRVARAGRSARLAGTVQLTRLRVVRA
jgi:hypothetical protein